MIYTEIEKVLRDIVFAKEQEQRQLTDAEQEIYEHWQSIKSKVENQKDNEIDKRTQSLSNALKKVWNII